MNSATRTETGNGQTFMNLCQLADLALMATESAKVDSELTEIERMRIESALNSQIQTIMALINRLNSTSK